MVGAEPYEKICKSCCQQGKEKTEEHRAKLSESIKATQTEEVLNRKSQYNQDHPEVWKGKLVAGQGGGWNKGLSLPARDEETRQKISKSMKNRRKNK
jgi:hypothetical protein